MRYWRINSIFVVFCLLGAAILAKLFFVQVIEGGHWKAWAQGQQKVFSQVEGDRGEILIEDSDAGRGYLPLAINKDWEFVYISPKEINAYPEKIDEIVDVLSNALSIDKESILEKIHKTDSDFEVIKNKLSQEESDIMKKIEFPGVHKRTETIRYYPRNEFASQILGFLGGENLGQYGIEGYYDDLLRGKEGFQISERGVRGLLRMLQTTFESGSDVVLTIDYNVQFMAEKLLKQYKESLHFNRAQILVGDPNTGRIIAMAEYPGFNPNEYSQESDVSIFQNSTIQRIFEPGSVFKPITMAMALDMNKVTPQTKYVDTGILRIGGYTIQNFAQRTWGERTMTEVLEKSINTGAVYAENQVGNQNFLKYIEKFGFFDKTGIDLQGEVASSNMNLKNGREVNFATAAFGQGIEITPMQLFRGMSVIANGGKLIKPYITLKTIKEDKVKENESEILNQSVISQQAANQLVSMMVNVVEQGYGKEAKIPGYYVAGKTGTAQVPFGALGIDRVGYSDQTIQSFIGFAPAFRPKFLILVKLDNPQSLTAEYSAGPIFHDLAQYIIDLWQIPPDYDVNAK